MQTFDKEESPQLQIHDALRGIILRNKQATAAPGQFLKVKLEPSGGSEGRILSCLQSANEKIKLLLVIPQLCSRIIHGSPETETALGFECTEALYQLFINQFTWAESKKDLFKLSVGCWTSSIPSPESDWSHNGRTMGTGTGTEMEIHRKPGVSPDKSAFPCSSTHVNTTKLEMIRGEDEMGNGWDSDSDALLENAIVEAFMQIEREGIIDDEPSQDKASTSAHLQLKTYLVTLIHAALEDEKCKDHVRKCLRDNDLQALLVTLNGLNRNDPNDADKLESESQSTDSTDSTGSTESSKSTESITGSSITSSTGISDVAYVEPLVEEFLPEIPVVPEKEAALHCTLTPQVSSKSLESLYIDQLFQTSSSSDFSTSAGSQQLSTESSSSETDKRNMEYEIQAVLEKNASLSSSSASSVHFREIIESDTKEMSIDNGSGTSLGLKKDVPIFVEVSRKPEVESTSSSGTTSQFSSISQSSSGQTTTATGSGLSNTSELVSGIAEVDTLLSSKSLDLICERKPKMSDAVKLNQQPKKGNFVSNLRNRMKQTFDDRRRCAEVAATAFGMQLNDYLLQQVQASYARVLRLLTSNYYALEWIKTKFKLNAKDYLKKIVRVPPPGCTKALVSFYKYMTGLERLTKERLLMPVEVEDHRVRRMRYFWIREKLYLAELEKLEKSMKALEDDWAQRVKELDEQHARVEAKMKKKDQALSENIRNIVREGVTTEVVHEKTNEVTMDGIQHKYSKTESAMVQYHQNSIRKERNWRACKEELEQDLDLIIGQYDESLAKSQATLDELESKDKSNIIKILQLQKEVEDTDERFEEMRITKKLKELLRNMEMADSFKRNRAARVIQAHWRRYRARKLRKQRRKEKIKRKPRIPRSKSGNWKRNTDDTQSEISCATSRYSTPAFKREPPSIDSKRGSSTEKDSKPANIPAKPFTTKQNKKVAAGLKQKAKQK